MNGNRIDDPFERDLLERFDSTPPPMSLDVELVRHAGIRRRRTVRTAMTAGTLGVVALVGLAVAQLPGTTSTAPAPIATQQPTPLTAPTPSPTPTPGASAPAGVRIDTLAPGIEAVVEPMVTYDTLLDLGTLGDSRCRCGS